MSHKKAKIRFDVVLLLLLVLVIGAFAIFAVRQQSPESAAQEFMVALATKDIKKLTELSHLESPIAPLEKQWDFCVNNAAKNYVFVWKWVGTVLTEEDRAVLKVDVYSFSGPFPELPDPFEFPLIKVDGQWKVDLQSLTRRFFPALPR